MKKKSQSEFKHKSLIFGQEISFKDLSLYVPERYFFKILKICFTAYVKNLCEENNPGYIYNESVSVCYKIDSNPRLFTEAEFFCGESGGHLLRIDTERKQKFVEDLDLQSLSTKIYQIDNLFLR